MIPHGPWQIVKSTEVYRDPWMSLRKDDVIRPDGQRGTHSVVFVRPGVCVLALDGGGNVHLTEEFHYGVGRVTLEAVSGGCEDNEPAFLCAQRELREELGINAGNWLELGPLDPFTTNVVSPTELFLARELEYGPQAPDGTERIRRVDIPLETALAMIHDGRITHAPTCVLLLRTYLALARPR